jgi:deazaflavin-dependent oxidoreductase (nitroreductase family)
MPQILAILGAVGLGLAALAIAYVVGWRAKSGFVLGPIVWMSKKVMNPMQMRSAGTPGAYASIVRHRGRVSGTAYETPVGVVADGDGFLIALPYGSRAQWLRNVLAAGSATLVHEGATYRVDEPVLIPLASVANRFSASDQRLFRWLKVEDCLRLRNAERAEAPGGATVTGRAA